MNYKLKAMFVQKPLLSVFCAFSLSFSTCVSAQNPALSDTPLQSVGSIESNLMILMDSSTSMNHVLPPASYDPDATYAACSTPEAPVGDVRIRVDKTTGVVEYQVGDGDWKTWNSTDHCFDNADANGDAVLYEARLYANTENNTGTKYRTSNYGTAKYTGHFLNWYFSTAIGGVYVADRFIDGTTALRGKSGVERRADVAKTSAKSVVNGLTNLRVGLAQFNDDDGAKILEGLDSITATGVRSNILAGIDSVTAAGFTPLAEALADVGYYFVEGYTSGTVTLHPGDNADPPDTASAGDVLGDDSNASDVKDGPVYADSSDEPDADNPAIQQYCQANFVLAMTDGLPSEDSAYSSHLEDYDRDDNSDDGDALDDVAKALNDIDWRPDLSASAADPNHKTNIKSYFVGFAGEGLSDNQLLKDAGTHGGGGYQYAADSDSLLESLTSAVGSITNAIGSQASVAFNSTTLDAGSVIYSAQFNTADSSGKLFARSLNPDTGRIYKTLWEASEQLSNEDSASREVITYLNVDGATPKGVPFTATTDGVDLSQSGTVTDQQADLKVNDSTAGATDTLWVDRLSYIRGDSSKDGTGAFRERGQFAGAESVATDSTTSVTGRKLLGDIVHSTPVYVGKPEVNWPATFGGNNANESYEQFKIDQSARVPMVYVGANDGMLHGFNAISGEEVFGYVPALVLDTEQYRGLHSFTHQNYNHNYYVDLTPSVSDIYIDPDGGNSEEWMTVLIGGLRGGGKGYFALNITDAGKLPDAAGNSVASQLTESNAEDIAMWEFDGAANSADLGYSYSEAQIAKLNNGKWAAIFGNGYNSENKQAGLFIVYIEEGVDGTWSAGDWKYISTGVGANEAGRENGLSSPRLIDLNGDRIVDRVYAGDLLGNMWVFDLSATSDGSWGIAGGGTTPLFTAANAGLPSGAILSAPLVARNTAVTGGSAPNLLVMFGTGQYLNQADLKDNNNGAFYAVWDDGRVGITPEDLANRVVDTRVDGTRTINASASDTLTWDVSPDVDVEGGDGEFQGWKMNLATGTYDESTGAGFAGERVISAATLRRNTLFFSTVSPSLEPCASSGSGFLMSFDFRTADAGVDAVADFNGDGEINAQDEGFIGKLFTACTENCDNEGSSGGNPGMPGQSGFIGDVRCTPGSSGDVICDDIDVGDEPREGRLSWEEVSPR